MARYSLLYYSIEYRVLSRWGPTSPSHGGGEGGWVEIFGHNTKFDVQFCCGGTYLMPNLMKYIVHHEYCCMHNRIPDKKYTHTHIYIRIKLLFYGIWNIYTYIPYIWFYYRDQFIIKSTIFKCQNKCYTRTQFNPFIICLKRIKKYVLNTRNIS